MILSLTTEQNNRIIYPLLSLCVAMVAFLALAQVEEKEASAIGCPSNFLYFTGHTPSNQDVDGVQVSGNIRHRGILFDPEWPPYSCIRGEVYSKAQSTIDQVSWQGSKYENGDLVNYWAGSCSDCKAGKRRGTHSSWFLNGLGLEIRMVGRHYFRNGASTLWLNSSITYTY